MKKRAFVRYSKQGKIVPGSLILTSGSFPNGSSTWNEVPADLCCDSFVFPPNPGSYTSTVQDEYEDAVSALRFSKAAKEFIVETLKQHVEDTGSKRAAKILANIDEAITKFIAVIPAAEKTNPLVVSTDAQVSSGVAVKK